MLPVTAIARLTFNKLVAMFFNRRTAGELMLQAGLRWPKNISKEMSAREQFKLIATVKPYNHQIGLYEVAVDRPCISQPNVTFHELNLEQKTCTCGEWAVDGLPCTHVIAACHFRRNIPDSFVPAVFTLDYYRMCYAGNLYPVPTEEHHQNSGVLEELCTSWRPNSARLQSDLSIVGEFTLKTESPKLSVGSCPSPRSRKCCEAFMMRVPFGFVKQC
nr:uncharacterized protein LOC109179324 [Ipomoea batatas]